LELRVLTRQFDAYGALDWVVEFENTGASDSPLLDEILPLDLTAPLGTYQRLRLHHANGSLFLMDDFLPHIAEITPGSEKRIAPRGGRSSSGALPFMNLQGQEGGVVVAIGWSGQWAATLRRGSESYSLSAGMQRVHLRLKPGECIRTPRILLLPWEGNDPDRGNNLLRRLLLEHYLPRIDGELVLPPTAQCLQARFYLTGQAGEAIELAALPKVADLGIEAYWIDACWYGTHQEWWAAVGSWVPNPERFPRGLRPISDAAHDHGMKFVLWFEPERVRPGTLIDTEHPEYLLKHADIPDNFLFNLGLPEARAYLTEMISSAIEEHGVDIYRNDFNIDPLPFWEAADSPERIGMTEIRYIEGLYAFWDELRQRHPHIWIDNCASGGRRIDLETCMRSLPLWPSDFPDIGGLATGMGLHVGDQCINAGLARWLPLFGGGVWNLSPYGTRSEIMGGFTFGYHIDHRYLGADDAPGAASWRDALDHGVTVLDVSFPTEAARAAVAEWKSLRPFFTGDIYLLVPITVHYTDWCAWQLHRQDLEAGVALLFRRHHSPFPTMELALRAIDPEANYEVSLSPDYQEAPRQHMPGTQLANLAVTIDQVPGSLLLRYRRVP
jgi:alpha-galactosidase